MPINYSPPTEPALRKIFSSVFGIDLEAVTPETSPENLDEWDSFGHMRLVTAVEKEFGLSLTMEQIAQIDSFATLSATVLGGD